MDIDILTQEKYYISCKTNVIAIQNEVIANPDQLLNRITNNLQLNMSGAPRELVKSRTTMYLLL